MARLPKPPPPKAPKEAVRWFAQRVPFTRDELEQLDEATRKRAFYVSNVAQLRLVSDVHKAISKAIEKGTTLDAFKRAVGAKLAAEWGGPKPAVVETIFRTNVQSAYNAGRLEQFEDPIIKALRPMRGWSVILDSRTTEFICRPLATVVVPADSTFAKTHIPPLHYRCRTGIMALSAEERARSPEHLPDVTPTEGFGGDPRNPPQDFVDLAAEPTALRRLFVRKTGAGEDDSP